MLTIITIIWFDLNCLHFVSCSLVGQRRFSLMGHWRSWDFLTTLLRTLRMAVKDEQPTAQTTMNFHTDVSKTFHTLMLLKGHYEEAIADWAQYMDIISIDAYPNMYVSHPINVQLIVDRIHKIQNIAAAKGKPIIVMETGYPMLNSTTPAIDPSCTKMSMQQM